MQAETEVVHHHILPWVPNKIILDVFFSSQSRDSYEFNCNVWYHWFYTIEERLCCFVAMHNAFRMFILLQRPEECAAHKAHGPAVVFEPRLYFLRAHNSRMTTA